MAMGALRTGRPILRAPIKTRIWDPDRAASSRLQGGAFFAPFACFAVQLQRSAQAARAGRGTQRKLGPGLLQVGRSECPSMRRLLKKVQMQGGTRRAE